MTPRSTLQGLYGTAGTVFPDNTTGEISEGDMRAFGQDITDSHFNLLTDAYSGAKGLFPNANSIGGLKAINTVGLPVDVFVGFREASTSTLRFYQLSSGTDVENSPTIIRPSDYAAGTNEKVWKLAIASSTAEAISNLADGATVTWDCTGLVAPEAELYTTRTSLILNITNFAANRKAKLLIFKQNATNLTITFKYNGLATPAYIMPEFSGDLAPTGLVISTPINTFVQLVFDNHVGTPFNCVIVTKPFPG